MLPVKGLVAAFLLLSGAQARVPRVRLAARAVDTTTTPEPETITTTHFPLPFESTTTTIELESTSTASTDTTDVSDTTTDVSTDASTDVSTTSEASISTETSAPVDISTTTDVSTATDAPTTTETSTAAAPPSTTEASADPPTSFVSTGTGALVDVPTAASNAASSFTDLAGAASAIAANPTPSAVEVKQFQQQAQAEIDQLESIKDRLEHIDRSSLSEHDDEAVGAALVGLAALLGWFGTQMTALAPAVATPALASAVFAELAPAFAAAAAGDLLADALEGLDELDENNDDNDDDDDDDDSTNTEDGPTSTAQTSAASSTAPETTSTASETTTTATTTTGAYAPCGSDTCGAGGSCPLNRQPLSGADMAPGPTKVDCDALSTLTGPLPEGTIDSGENPVPGPGKRDLNARTFDVNTSPNGDYISNLTPTPDWVSQQGDTSGTWYNFPEIGQGRAGVNGIYGCTAVIIVSNKGVYLSHIWENPVFIDGDWNPTDDAHFTSRAIDALRDGTANAQSVAALVGDDANPGVLHSRNYPAVFVVTPWTGLFDPTGVTTLYRYEARAQAIADALTGIIPGSSSRLLGYTRTDQALSTAERGYLGRAVLEVDMLEEVQMTPDNWLWSIGKWRLWVENVMVSWSTFVVENSGTDLSLFDFPAETTTTAAPGDLEKRQEALHNELRECLVRTRTTSEATSTTSGETPATSTAETTETATTSTEESTATAEQAPTEASTTSSNPEESTTTTDETATTESIPTTFSTTTISSRSTTESEESTSTEATTSTRSVPNIRTVTQDGMICTLIEGSLHPVCHPISTPTPNPDGTNVHVNKGCILINGSPRCASDAGSISGSYESSYNVASSPDEPYSTILILSGFDSSLDNHMHAKATCQLQARWPADYGDIYFGEDGCLYDSGSNKIFDQCCSTPDVNNNGPTTNPYCPPPPPDAHQDHGNHDGSAICRSISKDTCLSAAQRYVDDVVYHQYTSAVWPDDTGKDIANAIFPIAGPIIEDFFGINYGCTVIWTCDNDDAFSRGMTGKQIKDSMLNVYNLNGAKGCGSTYLDNGCHITVNGCNNCRDAGHSQTLWHPADVFYGTFDDANDGFPPRR
ncbi:hypothetical protein FALBO_5308 [Fusarium albosuccineum]|uniref:Uncharacterized protein n=1 Tax=Fusarium albosuccineum TaxID=1237068 RepID=A0A8H4LHP3_9HYPO|nr:hypothetical protein FALBO_5308 [Fusarium albosuccineum]